MCATGVIFFSPLFVIQSYMCVCVCVTAVIFFSPLFVIQSYNCLCVCVRARVRVYVCYRSFACACACRGSSAHCLSACRVSARVRTHARREQTL